MVDLTLSRATNKSRNQAMDSPSQPTTSKKIAKRFRSFKKKHKLVDAPSDEERSVDQIDSLSSLSSISLSALNESRTEPPAASSGEGLRDESDAQGERVIPEAANNEIKTKKKKKMGFSLSKKRVTWNKKTGAPTKKKTGKQESSIGKELAKPTQKKGKDSATSDEDKLAALRESRSDTIDEQVALLRGDDEESRTGALSHGEDDDEAGSEWSFEEEANWHDSVVEDSELVGFQDTTDWRRQLLNETKKDSVQFYYIDTTDSLVSYASGMTSSTNHNGYFSCMDMSCM